MRLSGIATGALLCTGLLSAIAGAQAELHVWEGMWHSFFSDPEMPESVEAYQTIVNFFLHHLGHRSAK